MLLLCVQTENNSMLFLLTDSTLFLPFSLFNRVQGIQKYVYECVYKIYKM